MGCFFSSCYSAVSLHVCIGGILVFYFNFPISHSSTLFFLGIPAEGCASYFSLLGQKYGRVQQQKGVCTGLSLARHLRVCSVDIRWFCTCRKLDLYLGFNHPFYILGICDMNAYLTLGVDVFMACSLGGGGW